ncbi:MAG: adenylate/guanylate cyclase domain-containing protein [Alphaproteobacteria bacterium]|nr:adenylate/guanylate cyclase domain-containing protein [Alphaproteobacteria bacterium]
MEAISDANGEVLKFIGDGLLAVFSYDRFESPEAAAAAALRAARTALAAVDALPRADCKIPFRRFRSGIGLHEGRVFFGNIGGKDRLDFTVIGRAVNTASRIESLTKTLGRPILLTDTVADLVSTPLEAMGSHPLRGVSDEVTLFTKEGDRSETVCFQRLTRRPPP